MNNRFYIFLLTALCTIQSNIFTMDPSKFDDEPSSDEERLDLNTTPQPQPQQALQNNDANQNQARTEQTYSYASAHATPCTAFTSACAEPENINPLIDLRSLSEILKVNPYFLVGKNLNGANLAGLDLSNANLTDTKLNGANLSATNLTNATLERTELKGAILNGTILLGTKFKNADLSGAQITNVIFCKVEISNNTKFISSTIQNVTFAFTNIINAQNLPDEISCDFSNAKLTNIEIAGCGMESLKMQHITIEEVVITTSLLKNINLVRARINKFVFQNCPVIADKLDLRYAMISTGNIKGGIITRTAQKERRPDITEQEWFTPTNTAGIFGGGIGGAIVSFMGGAVALGSMAAFPPNIIFVTLGYTLLFGGFWIGEITGLYISDKFDDYREKYGISNINSILLNCDFHGTAMSDVCFSNIKLGNCANIQNMELAMGCLFNNVISSNPQDLIELMNKGAKVNGNYSNIFEFLWVDRDYEDFLKKLTCEILVSITHGAINGAAAHYSPNPKTN